MPHKEIKSILNGGMDLDTDPSVLGKSKYIDALNITTDAVQPNNDQSITNLISNQKIIFTYPTGTGIVIGHKVNTLRNTVIYFRYNTNGFHGIYEYNHTTRIITKILENLTDTGNIDILGFTSANKINSIDIYNRDEGDLLFFLDSLGRPTGLDITKFKLGAYLPVTRRIIDKAKCPPLIQPTGVYSNDTSVRINNTSNKLFRFQFRKVFDSFEKSSFSPRSKVPLAAKITDETYTNIITNNNVINISFPLQNIELDCKAIEIGVSYVDKTNTWSDLLFISTINRKDFGTIDSDGNAIIFYKFYNDATYPSFNITESAQNWDWIPDKANCQALLNGNVIAYLGITEGYDKDLIPNVVIGVNTYDATSGGIGSFNAILTGASGFWISKLQFSGTIIPGVSITYKAHRISNNSIDTISVYNIIAKNPPITYSDIATSMRDQIQSYGRGLSAVSDANSVVVTTLFGSHDNFTISVTIPSIGASDSISTFKWSTSRKIGIAYFDEKGKSNGVLYNQKVTMPAYSENGSNMPLLPVINASIYHQPPIWAKSYQWLLTKQPQSYFFWNTTDVLYTDANFIYFNITNINLNAVKKPSVTNVLNYAFKNGDRLRLIRNDLTNFVYDDTYDAAVVGVVNNPTIVSPTPSVTPPILGDFLKINKIAPFAALDFSSNKFVIEIYNQGQQIATANNETYYEFGEGYKILDAGTVNRRHQGSVTDQQSVNGIPNTPATFSFKDGDSYLRSRVVYLSDGGGFATFFVQDKNFVDFFVSGVSSVDGRPTIIDTNVRKAYHPTLIRHSQAYQANTNINGLNRFYSLNFDEYDYSFGDCQAMFVKERQLVIFHQNKIGHVTLYSSIGKDSNGLTVVFQTDKLLNPIQYYLGDYGIGTCPESIASFNFAIYGCDNIRGVIWRLSNDGLKIISQLYKVNSWANDNLPLRNGKNKIYGAFDQRLNNYIIAIEPVLCEPVVMPSFTLPNGITDTAYSFSAPITGSLNFTLSNIVKPSWMTILISGYNIVFSGKPTAGLINNIVSFTISNDCGTANIGVLNFNIYDVQTGIILEYGGLPSNVPNGYLLCDHSAVSRITYATLFTEIGVLHGAGDGTTTFNVPDSRKRVSAGYDTSDPSYNVVGQIGGTNSKTLAIANMPAHTHNSGVGDDGISTFIYGGTTADIPGPATFNIAVTAGAPTTQSITSPTGGGTPIDVTNSYYVACKIIKY